MEQFLRIGVITSSHGVKGEVKVFPTTDSAKRFEEVPEVIIKTGKKEINTKISGVRYFNNLAIVKFDCFNSPEEAKGYSQAEVYIERKYAQALEEGEYYIADLIGLRVVSDEGQAMGILKDVLQTGANDVYVVKDGEGKELLFPVISECIKNVDIEGGTVTVHVMPGLID